MKRIKGFTLVEIMVVLFIIGIATGAALFATGVWDKTRQLKTTAKQLTHALQLANQEALLRQSDLGIALSQQGLAFMQFEAEKNTWIMLPHDRLQAYRFPESTQLIATIEGQEVILSQQPPATPHIIISAAGEVTPFALGLGTSRQSPLYWVIGHLQGQVEWVAAQQG